MEATNDISIGIADDHAILRKGLAELINSMVGLRVTVDADNGLELLKKLDVMPIKPDVCILDINMPVMDGYATATEIRKNHEEINILALSMFNSEFNVIKMLRAGAQGYLLKNAQPSELVQAITGVVKHGFYHSDLVNKRMIRMLQNPLVGLPILNENEERFLSLCCTELTYKEIAEKMHKSPKTIDGYREQLFSKLDIRSRTGLVLFALKAGIVRI